MNGWFLLALNRKASDRRSPMNTAILVIALTAVMVFPASARAGWNVVSVNESASLPANAVFIEGEFEKNGATVRLHGVRADDRKIAFAVVDNPVDGEGGLDKAMKAGGFFAGVNGGYFHPDFRPVGLEIADGKEIHPFERAKLLSGVFAVVGGRPRLVRSSDFVLSPKVTHALQAGPFLVSNSESSVGLNDTKRARRTVIATDGKSGWAILLLSPVTLADASEIMNTPGAIPGLNVVRALNLDGGSSSALWAATSPKPFYFREYGSVRNYLGLRSR